MLFPRIVRAQSRIVGQSTCAKAFAFPITTFPFPTFTAWSRCLRPQGRRACSSHPVATSSGSEPPRPPADHRQLGVQQELFTTSIYSPGSPILLPNGARIFNRLVEFLRKQYVRYGFDEVITPTIYKKALWAKSGHLENYADDMFTVTSRSPPPPQAATERTPPASQSRSRSRKKTTTSTGSSP